MAYRPISRRCFIEGSITGGLAVGLGAAPGLLRAAASVIPPRAEGLTLKVMGDSKQGFHVALHFDGQPFAQHSLDGEFSACFKNEDRSVEDCMNNWKATSWAGNSTHVAFDGQCQLKNLNTTVFAHVDYEVIPPHVVRKRIRLHQADMFMLFYQLSNRLQPEQTPAKLWSFDQLDWQGEALREYFPAAGCRTKNGLCVGLLTDSGYRNQWTRTIRRDGKPVKPAPRRLPDPNLYSGSNLAERNKAHFFVQQTFGEVMEHEGSEQNAQTIAVPGVPAWRKRGEVSL